VPSPTPGASLRLSEPSDPLEREADRMADRVMRMTSGTVMRACSCSDEEVKRKADDPSGASRQVASGPVARSEVTPLGAGRPLGSGVKSWADSAFEADMSAVRVHTGSAAADAAASINARAYTIGTDIVFGRDQFRPDSPGGRHLLAHELTHVKRAEEGAARIVARTPVTVQGRTFEVGDVKLNAAASTDIRRHGNLLPSADQAHIIVRGGNKLGYEISYTTPEDPFRWQLLKSMIDNEHVEINGVGFTDSFNTLEVAGTTSTTRSVSLAMFMAGGITLPTLGAQQAISPGQRLYVASTSSTHAQIYYDRQAGGRGLIGGNALAHELFGHFALAMQGSPFGHGKNVPARANVLDPFGQQFVGPVDDYIRGFAGAQGGAFESPTHRVGVTQLQQAIADLPTNASGLIRNGNNWAASTAFDRTWVELSNNYRALGFTRVPPPPPSAPTTGSGRTTPTTGPNQPPPTTSPTTQPAQSGPPLTQRGVVVAVMRWFGTLSGDQQWVFRQYLSGILTSLPQQRPTDLARDVRNVLPAATTSSPARPTPSRATP
jgi:hypothetical protein